MDTNIILIEIDGLEDFPLSENQQRLINYLRNNLDDINEAIDLGEI
jgi:hypothetical protein